MRCNLCLAGPRIGCGPRFLRCLCFTKPRYTERTLRWVQFHVSPEFHHFCYEKYLLEGLPRKTLLTRVVFQRNTQLKATTCKHFYISATTCVLHTGSGIGATFPVSPKPSSSTYVLSCFSGIGAVPSDFTGALFCILHMDCGRLLRLLQFVASNGLCMFLSNNCQMTIFTKWCIRPLRLQHPCSAD